jgi:addiction module HigA family antidote
MLRKREPTRPGEILLEKFLKSLGLTQRRLADHLSCDVKVINRIVNGRTGVTPEMALKLGAAFQTSPEFWLNARRW